MTSSVEVALPPLISNVLFAVAPGSGASRLLLTAFIVMLFIALTAAVLGWLRARAGLRCAASTALQIAEGDLDGARLQIPACGPVASTALNALAASFERVEREAREERESLSLVLNSLGEGMLAIDDARRIVLVNQAALDLFDVGDRESLERRPFIEVVRNKTLADGFDRALEGAEVRTSALVDAGRTVRHIEMRVVPVVAPSGIAAVALCIDITRMEHLQRIRSDFVADFSHEVRTPLAGLRLALESLQEGGLDAAQAEHLHAILHRQIGRLERLVSDLAQLDEIESGEAVLRFEEIDLYPLVEELCTDFEPRAAANGLAIRVSGGRARAVVDPGKIQQVFSNLVDNAIKHSSPDSGRIEVRVRSEDQSAIVEVQDFGEGIPPGEQSKIFHRFYRVDKSRTARGEGSGLGLAIARHLVIRHQGEISVESAPGKGATFRVRLPAAAG